MTTAQETVWQFRAEGDRWDYRQTIVADLVCYCGVPYDQGQLFSNWVDNSYQGEEEPAVMCLSCGSAYYRRKLETKLSGETLALMGRIGIEVAGQVTLNGERFVIATAAVSLHRYHDMEMPQGWEYLFGRGYYLSADEWMWIAHEGEMLLFWMAATEVGYTLLLKKLGV